MVFEQSTSSQAEAEPEVVTCQEKCLQSLYRPTLDFMSSWDEVYIPLLCKPVLIETLTQSCFSCLSASSLGWPSFQAVKDALQVASLVPIVPPVKVKLVPSENVYVPSVALERRNANEVRK